LTEPTKRDIQDRVDDLEGDEEEDEPLMIIKHDDGTETTYL
jgi:hypothetical protein